MTPPVPDPRILVCDELAPIAMEILSRRGLTPDVRTGMDEDALVEAVPGYDALVVRSATTITRRVIEAADRLKLIGRAGVGVDNVDCVAATERGVVVMNTPTGNSTTTAELAISLICALARHIPRANRLVREGSWSKKGLVGSELSSKTLGVVGLGRIGRIVADRGLGLKMNVVAYDPFFPADGPSPVAGVELAELDDLLERADFVTLHVPLNDSTRNLLSWERVARMKKGARLVNASRGGVVDEEAVLEGLQEGRLAGAAFDVLSDEPPGADHPLVQRDDVIVTPHLGASSREAQHQVAVDIANQLADFLLDGVANNAVNAPAIAPEAMQELAPFLRLAEKLGSFLAQRLGEPVRKLELTVGGDIARHDEAALRLALLVGLLKTSTAGDVNFVNAPGLAKERGIRMLHSVSDDAVYRQGQLKVRASTRGGGKSHVVVGTVFGRAPRIVRIDDVHLDLPPEGPLLVTRHHDQPGVVGRFGTLLGDAKVNIRRVELGSGDQAVSGIAWAFLSLYDAPSDEVVARIAALDEVEEAQLLRL